MELDFSKPLDETGRPVAPKMELDFSRPAPEEAPAAPAQEQPEKVPEWAAGPAVQDPKVLALLEGREVPEEEPGFFGDIIRGAQRGTEALEFSSDLLAFTLGTKNVDELVEATIRHGQDINKVKASSELQRQLDEWGQAEGAIETLKTLVTNPRLALSLAAESLPTSIPPAITTAAGAVAGGAVGSLAGGPVGAGLGIRTGATSGLALGTGLVEYGSAFAEYLNKAGVLQDPIKLKEALNNPDFVSRAIAHSATKAGVATAIGTVGAVVGAGVAGKLIARGRNKLGVGLGIGTDAVFEGLAEAGGTLAATGEVDTKEAVTEAYLGLVTSSVIDVGSLLGSRAWAKAIARRDEPGDPGASTVVDIDTAPDQPVPEGGAAEAPQSSGMFVEHVGVAAEDADTENIQAVAGPGTVTAPASAASVQAGRAPPALQNTGTLVRRYGLRDPSFTAGPELIQRAKSEGWKETNASRLLVSKVAGMANRLAQTMGVAHRLNFSLVDNQAGSYFAAVYSTPLDPATGSGDVVKVVFNVEAPHQGLASIFETVMHEFGHVLDFEVLARNPQFQAIRDAAYQRQYIDQVGKKDRPRAVEGTLMSPAGSVVGQVRSSPLSTMEDFERNNQTHYDYWNSRIEWVAEQFARWASTSPRALSVVDKTFKPLASYMTDIVKKYQEEFGVSSEASPDMTKLFESLGRNIEIARRHRVFELMQGRENITSLGLKGATNLPETVPVSSMLRSMGLDKTPVGKAVISAVDKFNWFYKWMGSLNHVADRNPHISWLQHFRDLVDQYHGSMVKVVEHSDRLIQQWRRLPLKQLTAINEMFDWYGQMEYLAQGEAVRFPTTAELAQKKKDLKMSDEAFGVFQQARNDYSWYLEEVRKALLERAAKQLDKFPEEFSRKQDEINSKFDALQQHPYVPFMRYGDYMLTVRDPAGRLVAFYRFANKAQRSIQERRDIRKRYPPGRYDYTYNKLTEEQKMIFGLPPGLEELIVEQLQLGADPEKKAQLEQTLALARFEMAPQNSFVHRWRKKNYVPGYDKNFMRAYASYFFHGSRHLARVKYAAEMQGTIGYAREQNKNESALPGNKDMQRRDEMAAYLEDMYNQLMNPAEDWPVLRGMAFAWALGFSPAAAALNLSQNLLTTLPYLSQEYGDVKAMRAMIRASSDIRTFYSRGKIASNLNDRKIRILQKNIERGNIREAYAAEQAGIAEGRNFRTVGITGAVWYKITQASSYMFSMSEELNRRIAFSAAYELATETIPSASSLLEARANMTPEQVVLLSKRQALYKELMDADWSHEDAMVMIATEAAIQQTQFVYSKPYRPRFARGKLGTIFIFKTFLTNMGFFMAHNKGASVRTFLTLAFMGGLMGLPAAEDLNELIKALAAKFDKELDLEKEARNLVMEITDDAGWADLLLHGGSRYSFGLPHLLEGLGALTGMEVNFPAFDRSAGIGFGRISPVPMEALLGMPGDNTEAQIADTVSRSSGPAWGLFFRGFQFLNEAQLGLDDFKRWERIMPRAMANASRAVRYWNEGEERLRDGSTIYKFDPQNTEHMIEIIGTALGYRSLREAQTWDRFTYQREAAAFYDMRRQALMRQFAETIRTQNLEDRASVRAAIRDFNKNLPAWARGKGISADALRRSIEERQRRVALKSRGVDPTVGNRPINKEMEKYFPRAETYTVSVKN